MKIAYLDCFSGISGDMILGALVDLGLNIERLKEGLKKFPLGGYTITARLEKRHHMEGTRVMVKTTEKQPARRFKDIKGLINESALPMGVKKKSILIFENLAIAEAKVHGCKVEDVHFHEVGAIDSIVDIVGTVIGLEELKIDSLFASPLPTGSGWVETSHGRMPVPAPATMELLKGIPVVSSPIHYELTTPTGAAILKTLSKGFGYMPDMIVEEIGYGIGGMNLKENPNMLRIAVGRSDKPQHLIILETNIDDLNPQIYGYLTERLLNAGAFDAFLTPIYMKKGRPGILLRVLCHSEYKDRLTDMIFEETTTLGVRAYGVERYCLERGEESVSTRYGKVRIKVSKRDGRTINIQPEYEDCRKIADNKGLPLKEVMEEAKAQFRSNQK